MSAAVSGANAHGDMNNLSKTSTASGKASTSRSANATTASDPHKAPAAVTNQTVDPKDRKKKLVRRHSGPSKIKYYVWFAGHTLSIVFGLVTFVWQCLWLKNVYYINSISYRLSLLGSMLALSATVSKKFGFHYLPPFSTMLAQENFQYLVLCAIWSVTFKSVFKIIPMFLISVLQLSLNLNIKFVLNQSDFLGQIIAFDELFLVAYLFVRTLLLRHTSGYQLAVVMVFLWLRVLFDENAAGVFAFLVQKLDGRVTSLKNEKVLKVWAKIKVFLKEKQHPGVEIESED